MQFEIKQMWRQSSQVAKSRGKWQHLFALLRESLGFKKPISSMTTNVKGVPFS
jgi:hypothetical protein